MKNFLMLLLLLFPVLASAYDFEIDGIYYDCTSSNTVGVTYQSYMGYNEIFSDYSGDIIIPERVTYSGISYTVSSIEDQAFYNCNNVISITLPNTITIIRFGSFSGCTGLTSINIPSSVSSVSCDAFWGCVSLSTLTVDSGNPNYDSRENCNAIIETSSNKLIAGCKNTIIPNSVTQIGDYAFRYCSGLINITIPNSVTNIGDGAFRECI